MQQPNGVRAAIRSPQDVLGYVPGEARKLPSWPQVVGYFRELAKASDRVRFDDLGPATEGQPFVMLTITAPEIAEILRLVLGWAWTYVIVAELIGSSSGIGHMIVDSQALLATGQIIFGIIVIGMIGLVSDFLFKSVNQRLFPWKLA